MVYKCCVPRCNGNYPNGPKVHVFSFPNDENLRRKWIAAIHRDAFSPTKYSKVCELHFPKENVLKHTECFDETTGRKIVAPLYTPRLRAQSVPSIFPNCPQYLTVVQNKREDPEARRIRLDNSAVSAAISESLCTYKMFEERRRFTTFSELMDCLELETFSECWTVVKKKECVLFAFIDTSNFVPFLSVSACITCDLEINVFKEQTALKTVGSHIFPKKIQDIGQVNNILELLLSIGANVQIMVLDRGALPENSACNTLIAAMDRGGLLYPHLDMVNAVMYNYITVQKLIESSRETAFLRHGNQRELVINLTTSRASRQFNQQ
ncbi:uncharacterized protein LOC126263437 [Schistocerca nitens]|uniref:uncharacterized protein LOC126263437 n=1 Tax=Schistocerca nitens TaxID=7011 RepID=UPI0021189C80|nr:uncharacterized protein LOC126263437 [Schistocerca nitens]